MTENITWYAVTYCILQCTLFLVSTKFSNCKSTQIRLCTPILHRLCISQHLVNMICAIQHLLEIIFKTLRKFMSFNDRYQRKCVPFLSQLMKILFTTTSWDIITHTFSVSLIRPEIIHIQPVQCMLAKIISSMNIALVNDTNIEQECQTDTKYVHRICGKFNSNDNIFGSGIFDLKSRFC